MNLHCKFQGSRVDLGPCGSKGGEVRSDTEWQFVISGHSDKAGDDHLTPEADINGRLIKEDPSPDDVLSSSLRIFVFLSKSRWCENAGKAKNSKRPDQSGSRHRKQTLLLILNSQLNTMGYNKHGESRARFNDQFDNGGGG
jgi:hypothetical protein